MIDIEQVPDRPRCEMCGAVLTPDGPDQPERIGAETLRELAAIAHTHPSKAVVILEWYHGVSVKSLASKYRKTSRTIQRWLHDAREQLLRSE